MTRKLLNDAYDSGQSIPRRFFIEKLQRCNRFSGMNGSLRRENMRSSRETNVWIGEAEVFLTGEVAWAKSCHSGTSGFAIVFSSAEKNDIFHNESTSFFCVLGHIQDVYDAVLTYCVTVYCCRRSYQNTCFIAPRRVKDCLSCLQEFGQENLLHMLRDTPRYYKSGKRRGSETPLHSHAKRTCLIISF